MQTTNSTPTLLAAMVARFDLGDIDGAERCYREALAAGATEAEVAAAWATSRTL